MTKEITNEQRKNSVQMIRKITEVLQKSNEPYKDVNPMIQYLQILANEIEKELNNGTTQRDQEQTETKDV